MERSLQRTVVSTGLTRFHRNIHDAIAHAEERFRHERLGKEVGQIVYRVDVWSGELQVLDTLADEEVAAFDMFHRLVPFRCRSGL